MLKQQEIDKEEKKRKDLVDKKLAELPAKRKGDPPSKEEIKMKEREEQLKRDTDTAEVSKRQKEESDKVRKEVFEYRSAIDELQRRIRRSGENVLNWFNLFDANRDGILEADDFKRLLKHAGVLVRDQDLLKVFELIDLQQTGKLSYTDFINVVEKNVTLPLEKIVRKRRLERGESFIEGKINESYPDDEERMRNYQTFYGEFKSTVP